MTYKEKEVALLKAFESTNYGFFDSDKDEAFNLLGRCLRSFPQYANAVINEQITTPIIHSRYDGEELRNRIAELDTVRRNAHESAIGSLNILNRISAKHGLEPFAAIDTKDRHAVAEFVGQYVNELYNEGINGGMDAATYERRTAYDVNFPARHLRELADAPETNETEEHQASL